MTVQQINLMDAIKEASLPSSEQVVVNKDQLRTPYPGSDEAFDNGCKCSILNNFHGSGQIQPDGTFIYRVSAVCKMHGVSSE